MAIPADLSGASLDEAYRSLGGHPQLLTLVVSKSNERTARKLQEEHRIGVVVVPDGILKSLHCWALIRDNNCVWSEPPA